MLPNSGTVIFNIAFSCLNIRLHKIFFMKSDTKKKNVSLKIAVLALSNKNFCSTVAKIKIGKNI